MGDKHWGRIILSVAALVLFLGAAITMGSAQDEPAFGRPHIRLGTVYSAGGTPLRGTTISTEGNSPGEFLMTPEEMQFLRQNGLNALHIYAERRSDAKPVGASAANCDYLIDEAEKNGLTVVLTVGEFNSEADDLEAEFQFVYDFWAFYAQRYKDREHVVFEICNEVPLIDGITRMEADTYAIIREHAPDTPVLFFSFALTDWVDVLFPYVEELEALIGDDGLWENAAIAFHGYECQEDLVGADHFRAVIHAFTRRGYPLINTEVPNRFEQTPYPDTALLGVLEEEGISWLSFVFWERISVPSIWRGQLEAAGLTWQPDAGDWPVTDALVPFKRHLAWETVGISPAASTQEYRFYAYVLDDGDYLDLRRLAFGTREPNAFSATVKGEGDGILSVHADAPDGPLLGSCEVWDTAGEYREVTVPLTNPISGISDIYFVYASAGDGRLYFKDWQFLLPRQADYENPYAGSVFAADYPFYAGDIRRAPSTDPNSEAPLQAEGITDGSWLLFDFVGFQGRDVTLHLRALPLAGGTVHITAGDHASQVFELGECEITVGAGGWQEYTCRLDQGSILMFDPVLQRYDLRLAFSGREGAELFVLSEFWFEEE